MKYSKFSGKIAAAVLVLLLSLVLCPAACAELPEFRFSRGFFPVIDGSTSCVPLGKAIASVLLPNEENTDELIQFHKTTQSFRNLISGTCNLIISGQPEAAVFEEMEAQGFSCRIKPFATDALIFVVNSENPVDGLTTDQIRGIYSGKITNWKDVGGADAPIIAFQRNQGAGSQALMEKLVMDGVPMTDPVEGYVATEMGELMTAVKGYDNSSNAIGYSVYYYANDMKKAAGLKILSVDGVAPSAETIASGEYPHLNPYYTAIPDYIPDSSAAAVLYGWLTSEDGCALLSALGYVPVEPDSALEYRVFSDFSRLEEKTPVYTRLKETRISSLAEGSDYGILYPFRGTAFYKTYDGNTYAAGYLYGLFDDTGRIVCDPVYGEVSPVSFWDQFRGEIRYLPVWSLRKTDGVPVLSDDPWEYIEDRSLYTLASTDGRFVSEDKYENICGMQDSVLAVRDGKSQEFTVFGTDGNILMTEESLAFRDRLVPERSVNSIRKYEEIYCIDLEDGQYIFGSDGSLIAGPFDWLQEFSDGYAVVNTWNIPEQSGKYSMIDETGKTVFEGYDYISGFSDGVATLQKDGTVRFIGSDLETLFETEGSSGYAEAYGYQIDGRKYDRDGKEIFPAGDAENWNLLLPEGLFYREEEDGIIMYSLKDGTEHFFAGYDYASPFGSIEANAALPYFALNRTNENGKWESAVFDSEFNEIETDDSGAYASLDRLSGKWYLIVPGNGKIRIYDDQKRMREYPSENDMPGAGAEIWNGVVIITGKEYITAYRPDDGSVFFRYPVGIWTE